MLARLLQRAAYAATMLCLAFITPALAQNPTVSGRVTDVSGAVVPGAAVELRSLSTGVANATTTNAEGYFVLPPVPPGSYDTVATATGFKESRVDAVRLEIGQ